MSGDTEFDTPALEEVLQEETSMVAVPVRVVDPVRVDTLPTIMKDPRTYLVPVPATGVSGIIQILNRDPRRARVTVVVSNQDVLVSGAPGNLEKFAGGYVPTGIPIPMHWDSASEMHVRGVAINTAGADVQFGPATDVAVVTVFEEYWAR